MKYLVFFISILLLVGCSTPKEIITHDTIHYVNEHYNTIYDSVFVEHKNKEKVKDDTVFICDSVSLHHYYFSHDTITNDTTIYMYEEKTVVDPEVKAQLRQQKVFNMIWVGIAVILLGFLACKKLRILK